MTSEPKRSRFVSAHVITIHEAVDTGFSALNRPVRFAFVNVTEEQVAGFVDLSLLYFGNCAFVSTFGFVSLGTVHDNFARLVSRDACH